MNKPGVERQLPIRVSVDQGVNLKILKLLQKRGLIELSQVHDLEQLFKDVKKQGKAFTIGQSKVGGPDMIAGDNVREIQKLFDDDSYEDFQHVYAAYLNRSDYFITENPQDFIVKGIRETLEKTLGIRIRRTDEFVNEIEGDG